ncbi:MAG: cysteine-rich KTR domain-containing protein [Clostridiales bacterium]|nr:cysteine-rich KTR domain-containing protein [Clostridiales bacterium]
MKKFSEKEKTLRWIHCLLRRVKTRTKVFEHTAMVRFPLYCPKCKKEFCINAAQFNMIIEDANDVLIDDCLPPL